MLFADLLSLHLVTFLMFLFLFMSLFIAADACLSWSLLSIKEQQVSLHRLSMLSDLCACVHVKKKWRRNGSHSSSVSGSNLLQAWKKAMGWCTAQWKMLQFCAKTIVKESRKFELARLKKKKKKKKKKKTEKHFGCLVTFWFGTFAMLFSATGWVFHENARRWTVGCYNGL